MKHNFTSPLGALLGLAFIGPWAHAQTVTVLESFEDGVEMIAPQGDRVEFSQHTKAGADDTRVTHGDNALKITLTGDYGYATDGELTFSQEASDLIKQAWATRAEARYVVRFDVQFPAEGHDWGNIQAFLNGWDFAQLESNMANLTMSIPLDLITLDLAAEDLITVRIVNQYGASGDPEALEIYVDNFRLIDTYAAGAVPEITLLNGFETAEDIAKLVRSTDRYEPSLHKKTGADDLAVTQGEGSLELAFSTDGSWTNDFIIPFKGTIMEAISRLPQEARARYTLRMDVIFEDQAEGNWDNGTWQNLVIRTAGGGAQPFAMHRSGSEQHVRTYSVILDNFVIEPGDPEDPENPNPGFAVVNQGAWSEPGMTYHFDNIRIIDTGNAPLAIGDLVIVDGKAQVSWKSSESQTYAVETSADLTTWNELVTGVPGTQGGETTTYVDSSSDLKGQKFYRVLVAGAAPPLNEGFENGLNGWTATVRDTNAGSTVWEVGEPSVGTKTGSGAAGTDLDGDYTDGTHIALRSPEADLLRFISPPTMTFSYYLEADADAAARVNILDTSGTVLEEGSPDNGLFFTGNSDGWQEASVSLPTFGQKVIIEFEFVDGGNGGANGAGFYVDDVFISEAE